MMKAAGKRSLAISNIERESLINKLRPESLFYIREVLQPQHFHNIFTTNHRWLVVIGSNLNLTLNLLFCLTIIISNNLLHRTCCKNVVKILWTYHLCILHVAPEFNEDRHCFCIRKERSPELVTLMHNDIVWLS